MLKKVFMIQMASILWSQELPFGSPYYFDIDIKEPIKKLNIEVPNDFDEGLFKQIKPLSIKGSDIYYLELDLQNNEPIHFKLQDSIFDNSSTIYFIDLNNNGWVGPYTKKSFLNDHQLITGQLRSNNILIELSISKTSTPKNHLGSIIYPKEPSSSKKIIPIRTREQNSKILLTGYWPPSNEGIRHFSQNHLLNPDGWIGENWEDRGYDIISYFPTFMDPECMSCGQGSGDLEVDYQDTSEDWWNIVDSINPIAIITFSRGFIDFSWELEWQYFNYFYWNADFTEPYFPTPAPPDSSVPTLTRRYSNLPMDSIVSKIEASGLGLSPYIDYTQGAGSYLSEFMGYHGVWHKAKMDSASIPCIVAGHIHIGGLIDWETTREAVAITLREIIRVVDAYQDLPGDINKDGVISILDILYIVRYLVWSMELNEDEFSRADIDFNGSVDVFDLMYISNIISDW